MGGNRIFVYSLGCSYTRKFVIRNVRVTIGVREFEFGSEIWEVIFSL